MLMLICVFREVVLSCLRMVRFGTRYVKSLYLMLCMPQLNLIPFSRFVMLLINVVNYGCGF